MERNPIQDERSPRAPSFLDYRAEKRTVPFWLDALEFFAYVLLTAALFFAIASIVLVLAVVFPWEGSGKLLRYGFAFAIISLIVLGVVRFFFQAVKRRISREKKGIEPSQ